MDFPLSPYDDHWTAFITQPLINMSNPDDLRSVFKDPSDIEIHQAQMYPQVVTVLLSTQCKQDPIMALPIDPQLTPMVPTVVYQPTSNYISITPIIPTNPLFPPSLRPQRPYCLGEDIMAVRRGTCFVRVEARDNDHYWITCQVYYTGVEFSTWVDWGLVIDPNPQDTLSQLDWVESLMWLWWGHLSELIRWS